MILGVFRCVGLVIDCMLASNTKFEENQSRYSIGLDDVDALRNGMVTDGAGKVRR